MYSPCFDSESINFKNTFLRQLGKLEHELLDNIKELLLFPCELMA